MYSGYFVAAFDLLNVRDLDVIEQAIARCDRLVVGMLSDEVVEQRHGRPPVVPLDERMRLVAQLRGVDEVLIHEQLPVDHQMIFVLREDADLLGAEPVVILDPNRESASEILREALAPSELRAVA